MSILWFYKNYDNDLGECGHATWGEAQRLLPLLVDLLNERHPEPRETDVPFVLTNLLEDRTGVDEIYVHDADEFMRFITSFHSGRRMGAGFGFYDPLVAGLEKWSAGINAHVSPVT